MLLVYATTMSAVGITLSMVFQLAHCVEEAQFPVPAQDSGAIHKPWAIHQIETTVDEGDELELVQLVGGG